MEIGALRCLFQIVIAESRARGETTATVGCSFLDDCRSLAPPLCVPDSLKAAIQLAD